MLAQAIGISEGVIEEAIEEASGDYRQATQEVSFG